MMVEIYKENKERHQTTISTFLYEATLLHNSVWEDDVLSSGAIVALWQVQVQALVLPKYSNTCQRTNLEIPIIEGGHNLLYFV